MNGIANVNLQPIVNMSQKTRVAFQGDKFDDILETAGDAFEKATKDPDEKAIKSGIAAVVTVIGLFLAKQAPKIKAFIDKGKASNNKFLKAMAVVAGVVMSLLSVFGASKLFEGKVAEAEKETGKPKNDNVSKDTPGDEGSVESDDIEPESNLNPDQTGPADAEKAETKTDSKE